MLTSRIAELEKRDRLNAKGKDGGSFIPRAIVITGVTPGTGTEEMSVSLPKYININNILDARLMINYSDDYWIIEPSTGAGTTIRSELRTDENILYFDLGTSLDGGHAYRLSIFYKG